MVGAQLTLLMWFDQSAKSNEDFVEVYVLRYNIPSEDGKFFIERTLEDGRKIKIRFVPKIIRNKVKNLRFRFYEILKAHRVLKTELGRLIEPEEVESLRMDLEEWKQEYRAVQKLIDHYMTRPWEYDEWPTIQKQLKQFDIKWPPKKLDIITGFYVGIDGPIRIPKRFYDMLIMKALTNTEEKA